jgi:hypothetical protein
MIRGKLLTQSQFDNVTVPFKVQFTHLACVPFGVFRHITDALVPFPPCCHVWDDNFWVHPNVREDGWAQFLELYLSTLVREEMIPEGLTAQYLNIQPALWTSPDDKPSPYTCLPALFKEWVEMAKRGEPLEALVPGPPGWNSATQTPAFGTSAYTGSPVVSLGLSPTAHLSVVPECAPPLTSQRLASPPSSPVACAPLPPSDDEYRSILDKTLSTEEMEEWKKAEQKTA